MEELRILMHHLGQVGDALLVGGQLFVEMFLAGSRTPDHPPKH